MSFVSVKDVYKRYKMGEITINASDDITFDIEKGELAIVLGPSGSGKTTVLNMLGGMDTIDEGSVIIDGKDIAKYSRKELITYRRLEIGFIFQFYNLIQNLTAKENVELAAQTCKDYIPADEILRQVGLGERLDNFPAQLSGGEQPRVAIARALAKKPKLLLCDEPTGALDYETGKQILIALEKLCREHGKTVVVVTHTQEIGRMADRVIRMRSGRIIECSVIESPVSAEIMEW